MRSRARPTRRIFLERPTKNDICRTNRRLWTRRALIRLPGPRRAVKAGLIHAGRSRHRASASDPRLAVKREARSDGRAPVRRPTSFLRRRRVIAFLNSAPCRPLRRVAFTGYGQPQDRERARQAGFSTCTSSSPSPQRGSKRSSRAPKRTWGSPDKSLARAPDVACSAPQVAASHPPSRRSCSTTPRPVSIDSPSDPTSQGLDHTSASGCIRSAGKRAPTWR